jgi:HD superfamily phosphohydrolase
MKRCPSLLDEVEEFHADDMIRLAPNHSIPLTSRIKRLIDTRTFQRLRGVRQLSLGDRVYPSATHTRFSHALGVYGNMLDYLRQLASEPRFCDAYDAKDIKAILLAALLHDIGHYPFSHQLDHLPQFPEHEALTIGLLRGAIRFFDEPFSEMVGDWFDLDPNRIADLLDHDLPLEGPLALLRQLIDSPLDADKCDYLPRDSYFCGVDLGSGFDRSRFIGNLRAAGQKLAIYEKGLVSAERFQLARYWMYRSVYWGHTVRAFITMLSHLARRCFVFNPPPGQAWFETLVSFHDASFLDWMNAYLDEPGKELLGMLTLNRKPYQRLYTISIHREKTRYDQLQSENRRTAVTEALTSFFRSRGVTVLNHHLIWDVPPPYKNQAWESFPVVLKGGSQVPIQEESPIVASLGPAFLQGVRKIRLFIHPKLKAQVNDAQIPALHELIGPI